MIIKNFVLQAGAKAELSNLEDCEFSHTCVSGGPGGKPLVMAGSDQIVLSSSEGKIESLVQVTEVVGDLLDVKVDWAGKRVCLVGDSSDVIVYDLTTGKKLRYYAGSDCSLLACSWSPSGRLLAVVSKRGILNLLNIDEEFSEISLVQSWKISETEIKDEVLHGYNPCFVQEEKLIVAGKDNLQVVFKQGNEWTYRILSSIKHQGTIYHVAHLRGCFVATVGKDSKIKIWNLNIEMELGVREVQENAQVYRIQFESESDVMMFIDSKGSLYSCPLMITNASQAVPSTQISEGDNKEDQTLVDELDRNEKISLNDRKYTNNIQNDLGSIEEEKVERKSNQMLEDMLDCSNIVGDKNMMDEESSILNIADSKKQRINLDDSSPLKPKKNDKLIYDEDDEEDMRREADFPLRKQDPQEQERVQKQKKFIDKYFKVNPQKLTVFGATYNQGRRNYLMWNMYGSVVSRLEGDLNMIDIEYSLSDISKRLVPNTSNFTMASINYTGCLLASSGYIKMEDEYENEELDEELKKAVLQFIGTSFSASWTIRFPENENIEAITLGNGWCAAYTSKKMIRFFTPDGNDYMAMGFNRSFIGFVNYENLLAILYHDTFPFSGSQYTKMQVVNVSNLTVQYETAVHISADSKIRWLGFSEEGSVYVQDSKHMIWTLINESVWVPIYDGSMTKDMWILGVSENTAISLKLPYGELEPNPMVNFMPQSIKLKMPLITNNEMYREVAMKTVRCEQESFRSSIWGHMKNEIYSRAPSDNPMHINRESIKSREELEKMMIEADKTRIEIVRMCLLKDKTAEALAVGLQLETPRTMEACLTMMEKMKHAPLAAKLKEEAEKVGKLQYKYRTLGNTVYIPQIVYRDAPVEWL